MKIKFHNTLSALKVDVLSPEPAYKHLPEWYKEHESYFVGKKKPQGASTTATIKKCMPVFDMMTSGYLLPLSCDLYIEPYTTEDGKQSHLLQWSDKSGEINFHPIEQVRNHPAEKNYGSLAAYPKLMNPWAIQTPKGYSCLFIQPAHRDSVFNILPAIVDTDEWYGPVNFPFTMKDPNYEGMIPRGTFLVQVIPFKRDTWKIDLEDKKLETETLKRSKLLQSVFFDRYKRHFWHAKEYK